MIRKRKIQANYLKAAGVFELLGMGFTELNESPSAQTSSKRYINQSSATQSVTGYEWETSFNADQIVSENAIEYIRNLGEMQLTGADTETEYVIVDLDQPALITGFRARMFNIAVAVDSFEDNDGELGIAGNFLGKSDPVLGTFDTALKTFVLGFVLKTLEFSYTAIGAITAISVAGITYDIANSKFIGIPYDTTTFTFIDGVTTKTTTLGSSWTIA